MTKGEMIRELRRLEDDDMAGYGLADEPHEYVALVLRASRQRAKGLIKPGEWPMGRAELRQRAAERGADDARASAALNARRTGVSRTERSEGQKTRRAT